MGYKEAITFGELHKAAMQCARGIRWKESVQDYLRNILTRTLTLCRDLERRRYQIQPYVRFLIHCPKTREIVSTRLRDRVVQRAMCNNGLYADLVRGFIYDNCACLVGKGVHFAQKRLAAHMHRYYRRHGATGWVLKMDIRKFFPSIPHTVAKSTVAKRVRDPDFVRMVADIVDSFGDSRPPEVVAADPFGKRGIALGSQISQLVALAVLDDLDHIIKERLRMRYYVRYMDDLVILHPDRNVLRAVMLTAQAHLAEIGLQLNPKSCIYPVAQGVLFLKFRYLLTPTGKVVKRVTHEAIGKERRKLRALHRLYAAGEMTGKQVNEHFTTWVAHMNHANSRGMVQQMRQYGRRLFNSGGTNGNAVQNEGTGPTGKAENAP